MKNPFIKESSLNFNVSQKQSTVFKAFYFILEKLDSIHETITNNNNLKLKHSYLEAIPDEQKAFYEIQKTLSCLFKLVSTIFKQQNHSSLKKNLNNIEDVIMNEDIHVSFQQNNKKKFSQSMLQGNDNINQFQNFEKSYLNQSVLINTNPYDSITNNNLNQSHVININHKRQPLSKISSQMNIYPSEVTAIAELGNQDFVVGSQDGSLSYCWFSSEKQTSIIKQFTQKLYNNSVAYICALESDKIVSLSSKGDIDLSTLRNNGFQSIFQYQAHRDFGTKVIKFNQNKVITCGGDSTIKIHDFQSQKIDVVTERGGNVASIIKLQKIGNDILVSSRTDKNTLNFWNLENNKLENSMPQICTNCSNGMVELSSGYLGVANCIKPFCIKIIDVFNYRVIKEIREEVQIYKNKSLYVIGNSFCCIVDQYYYQISNTSFKIEFKYFDKNIKPKGGFVAFENGKYIGIPNSFSGISIYKNLN